MSPERGARIINPMDKSMKKVIFDTDIGIDDAMALLFLHRAAEVDLVAITTGFGNASLEDTTRNALYTTELFEIDTPVYAGASDAMGEQLGEGYPDFVHGKNGLGDIPMTTPVGQAQDKSAAQAIVDLVRANPGEIIIVAVGRMTNVALALAIDPELPKFVKELIVMGGFFGYNGHRGNVSPVAEANIAGDPTAADIVFTCGMPTTIVGLDVTLETVMDEAYIERLRQTAGHAGEFIYQITRHYFAFHARVNGKSECPIHDASAVAFLLKPELFRTESAIVRVATQGIALGQTIHGQPNKGYATDDWDGRPACDICVGVDAAAVMDLYLDTLALQ
jgi:purine nucleosidase